MKGTSGSTLHWALRGLLLVLVLTLGSSCRTALDSAGEGVESEVGRRRLVIVSVDTLRADALGFAGYPAARTPSLDALAARGTWFPNAIAPIPRTTPSLGSLLTGRWPQHHGSREVGDPILDSVPTLAEQLRRGGYTTLGVSINDSAGPKQGLARGFDYFATYRDLLEDYGDDLYQERSPAPPSSKGWATATTERTLQLVDDAGLDRESPYFLWVFYFDPHFVYRPPAPWQDGVEASRCWDLYDEFWSQPERGGEVFADIGGVSSHALADCRRLYDAEVAYTDRQIGVLLEGLETRGLLEETLVVFTADHGENFGEGGLFFEHGENAHDAGLRVPLVFAGPDVAAGRVDATAVSLVDVLPTALHWLGVSVEEGTELDGDDLLSRLSPGASPTPAADRIVFAESASALWNEAREPLITGRLGGRVCANGEWLTLRIEGEQRTVFDRREDPALTVDIVGRFPEEEKILAAALQTWPAESARQRVARTARFKLVQFPRLEGGYRNELYDLRGEGEGVDVSQRFGRVAEVLGAAVEDWATGIPRELQREADAEREQTLRSLGYLK
ncbi:MAG: sulfatase [Thermoanaerobaculia bacterium]|nr:sulfatase [Thermoanaerobaculia bacterium]